MPLSDFDSEIRDKFERHEFEYKPAQWERLSQQLSATPLRARRNMFLLTLSGIAAAAALLIGVSYFLSPSNIPVAPSNTITAAIPAQAPVTSLPAQNAPVPIASIVAAPVTQSVPAQKIVFIPRQHIQFTLPAQHNTPPAEPPVAIVPEAAESANTPKETVVASQPVVFKETTPVVTQKEVPVTAQKNIHLDFTAPVMDDPERTDRPMRSASLSVAGGYKFGSSNLGYMVGLNARKNLGSKVFIEGDLAFANSRNAQQTKNVGTETFDVIKSIPGGFAKSANTGRTVINMYYLQLTPTVGYHLSESFVLGAGADIQRLFQDNASQTYIVEGDGVKAMPLMDYGVVAKTEYKVLRNVSAGLQYRLGMNNVIAPDKDYTNRSYLQVQLKLGLLGK